MLQVLPAPVGQTSLPKAYGKPPILHSPSAPTNCTTPHLIQQCLEILQDIALFVTNRLKYSLMAAYVASADLLDKVEADILGEPIVMPHQEALGGLS